MYMYIVDLWNNIKNGTTLKILTHVHMQCIVMMSFRCGFELLIGIFFFINVRVFRSIPLKILDLFCFVLFLFCHLFDFFIVYTVR